MEFCSAFHKMWATRFRVCRTAPNPSALESPDTGTLHSGSNFEIKVLGTDLVSFEVVNLPQNWRLIDKNLSRKYEIILWPTDHFKRDEIGSNDFDFKV